MSLNDVSFSSGAIIQVVSMKSCSLASEASSTHH
jgi:hypothetical protein